MGTTSTYFGGSGGGGGDTNKRSYRPQSFNNITFAANTQFSVPNTSRGQGAKIIPNTDTTFWLLEGNSSSDVYASYWTLDADTGSCTNTGSAVQLSNCDEVGSASANGSNRLIVLGGSNYDRLYHVYFNGSSITASSFYTSSSTHQGGCITSCGLDGTLYGSMARTGSQSISYNIGAIRSDGTEFTSAISTNIRNSNGVHRAIGTEDGIVACGPHWNTERALSATRLALEHNSSSSTLNQLYGRNLDVTLSSSAWSSFTQSNDTPFTIPTEGGVSAWICDSSKKITKFCISPSYYGAIFPDYTQPIPSSVGGSFDTNMGGFFSAGEGFARQANGTYLHFIGGSHPSNYVTFSDSFSYKLPFYTGRLVGNSSSRAEKPSSAIVGDYVLKAWYDETNTKVNIDAWNFRG